MPANRFMPNLITEELAFERLLAGGVVAVPTETVYGLACLAESADAVARVFKIKKRPSDNPLICHFHSVSQISAYVQPLSETEKILFDHFSPGPLSLLLRLNENSPLYPATRSGRTVVVRIPAHPVFLSLLKKINKPIAAPSANTSGRYSAVNTQMVLADVGALTDGIIEGGECVNGIESTIVEVSDKQVTILRPGVIGPDDLLDVLQSNEIDVPVRYGTTEQTTPGTKYKHYAPKTKIREITSPDQFSSDKRVVFISTDEYTSRIQNVHTLSLGSLQYPRQIASTLYQTMFKLDQLHADEALIFLPEINNKHWQITIRNRLNKMLSSS
jgi:L-threonylcarbamoyladenylate synthase